MVPGTGIEPAREFPWRPKNINQSFVHLAMKS